MLIEHIVATESLLQIIAVRLSVDCDEMGSIGADARNCGSIQTPESLAEYVRDRTA